MRVDREKIINFSFKSQMPDVGEYKGAFRIFRKTPRLDAAVVTTKAALTGGITPLTRGEMQFIDTLAVLTVYFEPVDHMGRKIEKPDWIDDILDQEILYALHREWLDFQNSFYPQGVKDEGQPAETPVQS